MGVLTGDDRGGWVSWDWNPGTQIPAESPFRISRCSVTSECSACSYPALPHLILGCSHGIPQISLWPVQGGIADPGDWPPGAAVVTPRGLLRRGWREPGTSQLGWEEPLAELPIRLALRL